MLVLVGVVSACYSPQFKDCELRCSAAGTCPDGFSCNAGVCRTGGASGECTTPLPDGSLDAPDDGSIAVDAWTFGTAEPLLPGMNTSDHDPTLTSNMRELYFQRADDIWRMSRLTAVSPWEAPTREVNLNASGLIDEGPDINGIGNVMFIVRDGPSSLDIHISTRSPDTTAWQPPMPIYELDPGGRSAGPTMSRDQTLVIYERLDESFSLWFNTNVNGVWQQNQPLTQFPDGPFRPHSPFMSDDKLTLYFHAKSATGMDNDLYEAHRATPTSPFGPPTAVVGVNTSRNEEDPWVSGDGRDIFFASDRGNLGFAIWHANR
jgi:hypothetical protein